jgi:hypothetical protein
MFKNLGKTKHNYVNPREEEVNILDRFWHPPAGGDKGKEAGGDEGAAQTSSSGDPGLDAYRAELAKENGRNQDLQNSVVKALAVARRKLARWRLVGQVSVQATIVMVSVGATLDIDRLEQVKQLEEEDGRMEEECEDWGLKQIDEKNTRSFHFLKKERIHARSGRASQAARSDIGIIRSLEDGMDKLRDKIIKIARQMEEAGISGSVNASVSFNVPAILVFGETIGITIALTVGLTQLLASCRLLEQENDQRNSGRLAVRMAAAVLPQMKGGTDGYCVVAIEGGKVTDKRRTRTLKGNRNPEWHEDLDPLPCAERGERLIVTVYDSEAVGKDRFIDEVIIPLDQLKLKPGVPTNVLAPLKDADTSVSIIMAWFPTGWVRD